MKDIVVVLGKAASGKSTFTEYVKNSYGYAAYEVGDYVRREYQRLSPDLLLVQFADAYYRAGKLTCFIRSALRDAQARGDRRVIISGLRTAEELAWVREVYPVFDLVKITCRDDIRARRYAKKAADGVALEDRGAIEETWTGTFLDEVEPDVLLENNGSLEQFYQKIRALFPPGGEGGSKS